MDKDLKLAVLIDADNIPARYVGPMMEEITKYGTPTIKRIYGDWTNPHVKGWKTVLLEHAINPMQQYSYTTGKNATDSAMIIDAMDILYSDQADGFCIASSDSDFTKLATRLREAGKVVYGIGEKKTPNPFIVACDKFIYLEILRKDEKTVTTTKVPTNMIKALKSTVNDAADEDGWAFMGDVGSLILKKHPNFDSRNYGFEKLTLLFNSLSEFEIESRDSGKSGRFKLIYVRNKS